MPLAVLAWVSALALAPLQDEIVQTRPSVVEAPDAPDAGGLRSLERNCQYGGQPVSCPRPVSTAVPANAEEAPPPSPQDLWSWLDDDAASPADETEPPEPAYVRRPPERPRPSPSSEARDRNGCRRETYRSPDGGTTSFSIVCGSGDPGLLDDLFASMRERTAPSSCDTPFQGEDKAGFLARCGGIPY